MPLLQPRAAAAAAAEEDHGGGGGYDGKAAAAADEEGRDASWSSLPLRRRAWEENKKLWVVAGPSIFTRFASFGVTVISQAFIGHIGATELAAYALVSTVLMRFSNGILVRTCLSINPFVLDSCCSHNSIHVLSLVRTQEYKIKLTERELDS